jgi:hypothetical protein
LPILLVVHEDDGDRQFLDGGFVDEDDAPVAVHIGDVFDKHPERRLLADLPEGWAAERDSVAEEWRRFAWPSD